MTDFRDLTLGADKAQEYVRERREVVAAFLARHSADDLLDMICGPEDDEISAGGSARPRYPTLCVDETCARTASSRGLCNAHYMRLTRGATVAFPDRCILIGCDEVSSLQGLCEAHEHHKYEPTPSRRMGVVACMEPGCEDKVHARDRCQMHYYRARADGVLPAPRCEVDGCSRVVAGEGLCKTHQRHAEVYGELLPIRKYERGGNRRCDLEDCDEPHAARGMCKRHYGQVYKNPRKRRVVTLKGVVVGCQHLDCEAEVEQHGFCREHRLELLRFQLALE